MSTVSVNLLPPEIILQRKQSRNISLINKISIVSLLILVFLTSAAIALRISQNLVLKKTENNLVYAQDKLVALRGKEGEMVVLKQLLGEIQASIGGDDKKKALFNLMVTLIPADVQVTDISLDSREGVSVSLQSASLDSIERYISDLGNKEKNMDLISKIDLDSLSLGKDSVFRLVLRLTSKS